MRILITGSTGLLGREIGKYLLANGHEIVGLHRNKSAELIYIPSLLYTEVIADLASIEDVVKVLNTLKPCDIIIHSAASLKMDLYASEVSTINCAGLQNILWLASQWRVSRFIFFSSVPVIGKPQYLPITEEHPTSPNTVYHTSKLFGEQIIKLAGIKGLSSVILRITAPVGPRMPKNRLLSTFIKNALKCEPLEISGLGTRRQNYIDVRDVARSVDCCLSKNSEGIFNISSECSISNIELAKLCIIQCSSKSKIHFKDAEDPEDGIIWDVCNKKAKSMLGFEPIYNITDTIDSIKMHFTTGGL